jgi:uncharacterized protein DUF3300
MLARKALLMLVVLTVLPVAPVLSFAQETPSQSFTPEQLDKLVARIALYPDSLLAQVLAAATYSDQIPDAARWADQHHYLTGQALADAIQADHLPWDPSVQALLPFPSVLEIMANDVSWTTDLGNAFLSQQQDVMDACRESARRLRSTDICAVTPRSSSATGRTSRLCPCIRPTSRCRTMTRQLFSSHRHPESWSAV